MTAPTGIDILVVENPRIAEAAAQRRYSRPIVATNGDLSTAVPLLLSQLVDGGASPRYHGDFDAAGLAICARMAARGLRPWRMDATDYLAAIQAATSEGVTLPLDPTPAPPTPWDPTLQTVFDELRLVVHEERLLDLLLI